MIYLTTFSGRHRETLERQTFYYSSSGYNHPSAPAYFEARIKQPALFRRDIFEAGKIGGGSRTSWGEMTLVNSDGKLDYLSSYAFDDENFVLLGIDNTSKSFDDSSTILTGTIEQIIIALDVVRIRIRDRKEIINVPLQTDIYGGTNQLPDGIDGSDDIKGTIKPDCYGLVFNAEPVLVNKTRLIYQVDSEKIFDVTAVYDSGLALTRGTVRESSEILQTVSPAAGTYDLTLTDHGSFFRLSSSPAGRITVDLMGKVRSGQVLMDVSSIMRDILLTRAGLTDTDISDDFRILAQSYPAPVGLWSMASTAIPDLLDALAASAGAWWGFDRVGRVRITQISPPSRTDPVAVTFKKCGLGMTSLETDIDLTKLDIQATQDTGRGIPVWRVKVGYGRSWTIQDASELVANATRSAAWSSVEYRFSVATNSAIQDLHPAAGEVEIPTLLAREADAQALAQRMLTLYGQQRSLKKVEAVSDHLIRNLVDLGQTVAIQISRLGFEDGAPQILIGLRYDLQAGRMEADLWG